MKRATAATRFFTVAAALAWLAGCATPPPMQQDPAPVTVAGRVELVAPPAEATSAPADSGTAAAPPVDPLRPEAVIDPEDAVARTDLWLRVRRGFAMADLDNKLVRRHERYYADRPEYLARMTERASLYLFHIVEEVERRNMPTELALLPFIESAFNPQAMSRARASGMWQFIPSTGRVYDLTQNAFRDDRRAVLASTRAALDYLGKLYGMFGDWQLALAAYNWGEGSVQRAISANRRAGKRTDYASLRMPNETRNYLPKLQAMKNIVARPEAFSVALQPIENHPYFLSVPIERDIDVALAAQLAGLELDEFKALNPQMNRPIIVAAGTPQLLLPYDNANRFVSAVNSHKGALASWTTWVAPKTMRPADVARQVGMSEADLRDVNRIPAGLLVRTGSTLLVPRNGQHSDIAERVADQATIGFAPDSPPARRITVRAGKRGESVASVARRYKVNATQLAAWNNVPAGGRFQAGEAIVIYVVQKAMSTKAAPARATRAVKPRATRR